MSLLIPFKLLLFTILTQCCLHVTSAFLRVGEENFCVSFPSNGSLDIGSSINIICTDGLGEMMQGEVCFGQETDVNEISSGTTVNEGSGFDDLSSSS